MLEALSDDQRLRRSDVSASFQRRREKITVDGRADLVLGDDAAEDELEVDRSRFGLDPDVDDPGEESVNTYGDDETFGRGLRRRVRGHGDKLSAFALVEDVQTRFGGSVAKGVRARNGLALEREDDVGDDGLAVVVENLAGAKFPDVVEIPGRGRGDDFVAGSDGELDRAAPDAGGASPDEESLTRWLCVSGWIRELEG